MYQVDPRRAIGGAVIVVAVVVAVAAVLGGSRSEVVNTDDVFDADRIAQTPLIVARHESGGFSVFGIQFTAPDHWLSVGIAPRPACLSSDADGNEVLNGDVGCEEYASLAGPVRGGGINMQGIRWIEMQAKVSGDCFDAVTVGEPWPTSQAACR